MAFSRQGPQYFSPISDFWVWHGHVLIFCHIQAECPSVIHHWKGIDRGFLNRWSDWVCVAQWSVHGMEWTGGVDCQHGHFWLQVSTTFDPLKSKWPCSNRICVILYAYDVQNFSHLKSGTQVRFSVFVSTGTTIPEQNYDNPAATIRPLSHLVSSAMAPC